MSLFCFSRIQILRLQNQDYTEAIEDPKNAVRTIIYVNKFFPFHFSLKTILWIDITKAYVRTYDPIGEYGGWGFKGGAFWNRGKGKCINVSGDVGIQIEFKNGKKLLIGTQKESDTKRILETYKTKL